MVFIILGYTAKSVSTLHGGGAEYLCLPSEPQWTGDEVDGLQFNTYIYGVEYFGHLLPNILPDSDRHMGVPCSVCETENHNQLLMVPAATSCPAGWTKQYLGYLMAERYTHASSSNYICVTRQYETMTETPRFQTSGYVATVEAVCTSLPCPNYVQGRELPCVVCTK